MNFGLSSLRMKRYMASKIVQGFYLFFLEFRGQLDLSFVYNEAYQDMDEAQKMLNSVVEILEHELLGSK